MALLFGFGTVHWYHAANGAVWYFAHVVALMFLWLALLEVAGAGRLVIAGLCISAAYMARMPALCAAVFVVTYFWERTVPQRDGSGHVGLRRTLGSWLQFGGLSVRASQSIFGAL